MRNIFKNTLTSSNELNQNNYQSLLIALMAVLIPHLFYMPIMVALVIGIILLLWQVLLWKYGHFKMAQNKWLQYSVVILALGLIYLNFRTFLGVEAGVAALAVILLGKAFEVRTYRDAIVQVNFALFVLASLFLYGQEIYLAVIALIGVVACFYSMYQLQSYNNAYEEVLSQDVSSKQLRQHALKTVGKLLLLATPLMVLLFLFFPRIPPLWSIPQPSQQAKTGVSDEMSPGDIAQLSQSSELAFRVVFDQFNQMPEKSKLYWRAIVLEQFDGVRWKQHYQTKFSQPIHYSDLSHVQLPTWYSLPQSNQSLSTAPYKIIYEPSFQIWAYALEHSVGAQPINIKEDLTLQFEMELLKRRTVDLHLLKPQPAVHVELDAYSRQINTYFEDATLNPRSQAFAKKMWAEHPDPQHYSQALLKWIRTENFSYTLSPPLLRGDRIDDFLFRTRAGFCEHYASAYVNLMRMVGIPARVVTGYQGGQWAPDQKSWEVRQLDAHAWTEVWFEGKGWVRVDPTAAIAPERVEMGMQEFTQQNEGLFGDDERTIWQSQRYQWLTKTRIWMDYANYQWQSKVVGFDQENQRSWLQKLSIKDLSQQLIYLIVGIFVILGLSVWWLSRQQRIQLSQLDKALQRLSKKIEKVALQRLVNEPVLTWFKRIEQQTGTSEILDEMTKLYTKHLYISALNDSELKRLYHLISKYTVKQKTE